MLGPLPAATSLRLPPESHTRALKHRNRACRHGRKCAQQHMQVVICAAHLHHMPRTESTHKPHAWLVTMLCTAKIRKRTPPAIATVRWEMRMASSCPPTTAVPVHSMCPITAPAVTPYGLYTAASDTVAICDLSPHSAMPTRHMGISSLLRHKSGATSSQGAADQHAARCLMRQVIVGVNPCG